MRLAILGGGQLGRMLVQAARPLGVDCVVIDRSAEACAGDVAPLVQAEWDDVEAIRAAVADADAVTFEVETIPEQTVAALREAGVRIHPGPRALHAAQDRLVEKRFLREHGVDTAPFAEVGSEDQARAAVDAVGLPSLLKTRRDGYDGRGQRLIESADAVVDAWRSLESRPCILEGWVDYDRELSLISVRSDAGEVRHYPLIHNEHHRGVLAVSHAPAPNVSPALQQAAEAAAERILAALDYVGVLTIEFFEAQGRLLANEMAPRVHNSGHCLIEGAEASQFSNHVRAVLALPLGSTVVRPCGMVNLLGQEGDLRALLDIPGVCVHRYNKSLRPNRKVGHITVVGADRDEVEARLARVRASVG